MADFRYKGTLGGHQATGVTLDVKSGTTASIAVGDLVIPDASNAGYFKKAPDSTDSTATYFTAAAGGVKVYLATTASDETAGADGTCEAIFAENMVLEGAATTASNLTQARVGQICTLDNPSGTQTIDEDDSSNGFMRIRRPAGGASNFDTTNGIVEVVVNYA